MYHASSEMCLLDLSAAVLYKFQQTIVGHFSLLALKINHVLELSLQLAYHYLQLILSSTSSTCALPHQLCQSIHLTVHFLVHLTQQITLSLFLCLHILDIFAYLLSQSS